MKRKVRLTESDLHNIIKESVKRILSEAGHLYNKDEDGNVYTNSNAKWHDVEGTTFISHGEWSDPEVLYDGEELNYWGLEDYAWENYKNECEEMGKEPYGEEFENLPSQWFKEILDDYMYDMFSE
jgi:hypothetical protein